jgi:hypothetical protein
VYTKKYNLYGQVRFQVYTAVSMKIHFWDITPCSLVEIVYFSETTWHYIPEGSHLYVVRGQGKLGEARPRIQNRG